MEELVLGLLIGIIASMRLTRLNTRTLSILQQRGYKQAVCYGWGVRLAEFCYFFFYSSVFAVYRSHLDRWAAWSALVALVLLYIAVRHLADKVFHFPETTIQVEKPAAFVFRGFIRKILTIRGPLRWLCLSILLIFTYVHASVVGLWFVAAPSMLLFTWLFVSLDRLFPDSFRQRYARISNVVGNVALIGLILVNILRHLNF